MMNKLIYFYILYNYIIMNYQKKYIKYKNKYLQLQNIINSNNLKGGAASSANEPKKCSYLGCNADADESKTCLCKSAFYCTSKHQVLDWKNHKPFCLLNNNKPSAASSVVNPKEANPTAPTLSSSAASSANEPKKCSYLGCNADASKTCPCNSAFYCSIKHQQSDWPNHKPFCLLNNNKPSAASSVVNPKEANPTAPTSSSSAASSVDDLTEPTSMPSQTQKGETCWAHACARSFVRTFQVLNIITDTDDKIQQWYELFYSILLKDRTCDSGGNFSDMIRLYNYLKNNIDRIIDQIFDNPLTEDQIKIKENLKLLFENEIIFPAIYPYAVNPNSLNYPTKAIKNMLGLGLQPVLIMTFSVSLAKFINIKTKIKTLAKYDLFSDQHIITECTNDVHVIVLKEWFENHLKIRNSWGVYGDFSVKDLKDLICTKEQKYLDTIIDFGCLMINTEKLFSNNVVIKKYRSIIDSNFPYTEHNYTNYDNYGFPHGENCELKDYNNNTFFQGKLIHGIKNGKGTFIYLDSRYEGDWVNDQRNGKGKFKYPDSSVYEGDWVNDQKHGKGKFTYLDSSIVYEGNWENDQKNGKGKLTSFNSFIYEGDWVNNTRYGKGVQRYTDGSVYEGDWVNNTRDGTGKITYLDGSVYEGDWENDKKHGKGKYIDIINSKLTIVEGDWINDEFIK